MINHLRKPEGEVMFEVNPMAKLLLKGTLEIETICNVSGIPYLLEEPKSHSAFPAILGHNEEAAIKNIPNRMVVVLNGIQNEVSKTVGPIIAPLLAMACNEGLQTGKLPQE
ncbi:hypothetical protein O181_022588 [Austropuccinia psidii MF-1]|uniref:Uncharacterized protein n=1 Tax=Austropuccinia psidii MF-1 TaxID=1389203 RepID=A0A9Q3GWH6_9BASI|nr:hypothetical protein [Austropuccinia psidii MF-1]